MNCRENQSVEMARSQRGGERGGGFRGGRGGYGGGGGFHRGGGRGRGGYIQRLTRELYEEQDLNSSRLAEIERLSSTVDTQRDELAEAREELQQERNQREGAVERENYWEAEFQQQVKTIDNSREIVCKNCNTCNVELLSMTKLDEDLSEKVEEVKMLEKKVKEVESKEQKLRIYAAQKLEEAQRAEKHLAMKVREFDQLSSTINESACKKLEDENISLKQQIMKVGAEVKRLHEVEKLKTKMEIAAQEEVSKMKSTLAELNQVNLTKTRKIEYLSNQISEKHNEYELHTQQLLAQKELLEDQQKRNAHLEPELAKKTEEVEELEIDIMQRKIEDVEKIKAHEMELKDLQKENQMLSQRLQEAQNSFTASDAKNKVLEVRVDQFKLKHSTQIEENGKTQQHLDQIEGRNQVLTRDIEHLKNRNTEDNERHLKLLEEKTERITILEKGAEKLEHEKVVAQTCRRDENERMKALERETKRMKSEKQELKKELFEKTKGEKEMKSKQRMHFAMVDACISNMIKEKETPQSLITSLNLLKRCSQQFIDEDIEKEEPLKKRMKKEYEAKPKKQEIKEEYFELCDDVLVKNEEEEEEAKNIIKWPF